MHKQKAKAAVWRRGTGRGIGPGDFHCPE